MMKREELGDMVVFATVAEELNFTRAAIRLGVSQSAVSHTVSRLESSVGFKLLNRTSRRVSLTNAGEKLLATLSPSLDQINARIEELRSLGGSPKGQVRLTASKAVMRWLLMPVLSALVKDYPEIQVEINLDARLNDIDEERFDAGIRLGEFVGPDMIAIPISPPLRLAAVGSPAYFRKKGVPDHPDDLDGHDCLAIRFRHDGSLYNWEFEKDGKEIVKRVSGPFIFSDSDLAIEAAQANHGIAFVLEAEVSEDIKHNNLIRVLENWCPPFDGFHLFYSDRQQVSSALRLLIERLKANRDTLFFNERLVKPHS